MAKRIALLLVFTLASAGVRALDITVTNTNDSGPGSLRQAIINAVASDGDDTIDFDLSPPAIIAPLTALPSLNPQTDEDSITISASLDVTISGENLSGDEDGFVLRTDNDVLSGLIIVNFPGNGVVVRGGSNNRIVNCYIGNTGKGAAANGGSGILLENATDTIIGYDEENEGDGNVIGGNTLHGIEIGAGTEGTLIAGNLIGIKILSDEALPNGGAGIRHAGDGATIGGDGSSFRNVISGNTGNGIEIDSAGALQTRIRGNYIGVGKDGATPVPNGNTGIFLLGNDANNVRIGGNAEAARNVISGNLGDGLILNGMNLSVEGNYIGVAADAVTPAGNDGNGILIGASSANIGTGTDEGANLIAFNTGDGIRQSAGTGVTITRNGIFANGGAGIAQPNPVNGGILPPVITGLNPLEGTAVPSASIQFFADVEDEGRFFVLSTTAPGGAFSIADISPLFDFAGFNLTATATGIDGTSIFSTPVALPLPEGEGEAEDENFHSADTNENGEFDLDEVLRVIQFYNASGYECSPGTEDGYAPVSDKGDPPGCEPHSADYDRDEFEISLSEILRVIQIFTVGEYVSCSRDPDSDDGFCIGPQDANPF